MPRPPRLEFAGAIYHLTSRGNGRQIIFHTDEDRKRFLDQLQSNLETFDVALYAFVLMPNHYHLLLRTRRANLARFVQRLNTSYGLYYRYKHGKPGHVFQGRYKAKLVEGEAYLLGLTRYIHLNPVKTRAVQSMSKRQRVEMLETYTWSSYPGYASKQSALSWVDYEILRRYGRSWAEARRRYRVYTHAMVMESDEPLRKRLTGNAYAVGDDDFIEKVEMELKGRRKGDERDRDVDLPVGQVDLAAIDRVVAKAYGLTPEALKAHGHVVGIAKSMAMEIAVRLSGLNQREIGQHYGGISSSAVAMARRKLREAEGRMRRLEELLEAAILSGR